VCAWYKNQYHRLDLDFRGRLGLKVRIMSQPEPFSSERAVEIIADHADQEGALLPVLHALQHAFGHVPREAVPIIAGALNLSRADVHGVVTFYHDFRSEPAGRRVLKLCRAEACQARGGDAIAARAEKKLGVKLGETTKDHQVTLEPVYCLGLCASGPSAMLDDRVIGRLDDKRLDALVEEARS
jgi:formate dehydrogenase subunit gamma